MIETTVAAEGAPHPDFGQPVGDPREIPTAGGFDIYQSIGTRDGGTLSRLVVRIERRDGAWGYYPPTSQSPAIELLARKDTARRRAMTYARAQARSPRR